MSEPRGHGGHASHSTSPPWRTTAPLSLTVFVAIVSWTAVGPFVKELAEEFEVSIALVGQVSTVILITMALGGLVSGPLADHYGRKRSIIAGLAVFCVTATIMAASPSFWIFLAAGAVAGFAASLTMVVFGLTAATFAGEAQRKALSRVQASQAMGSVLGAPLLTTIAAFTVWRGAYVFVAVLMVIACILVSRSITADAPWPGRHASITSVLDAYRPILADRSMVTLFTASALRALGWLGPLLYIGAFYIEEHGLSLRQVGLAYMAGSGGLFLGNLAAGGPLVRVELRTLFAVTTPLMGLGWFAVFVVNPPILATVTIMALTAFSGGIAWVCMTSMLAAETPAGPATTMVLNMSIFGFSSALGVAIAGLLIATVGFGILGIVFPAFTLMAAALIRRPGLALAPATSRSSAD